MANNNSPSTALPTQQQIKDHPSVGPLWSLRLRPDDHSFVWPSTTLPSSLPTLPFASILHESPLSCITTDNSSITPSDELTHELVEHWIPTPKSNGSRRGTKTHDIHLVLLRCFCDSIMPAPNSSTHQQTQASIHVQRPCCIPSS